MTDFKQGVHRGISNDEYHKNDAVSRSDLASVRSVPAGALYNEMTGDMAFGQAAHTYVLENHLFDDLVIESKFKTATAKGHQAMVEDFPDKLVVTEGSIELIENCANAIWQHPKAAELLQDYIAEPTIYWKDEDTGLWCKTRPDGLSPEKKRFFDLKFLAEGKADPYKFRWSIRDFAYDLQAAWNTLGMKMASGVIYPEFWFIVVEKKEPFRVGCYQLDEDWLGDAMWECKNLLALYAACKESGVWPNYHPENVEGEEITRF